MLGVFIKPAMYVYQSRFDYNEKVGFAKSILKGLYVQTAENLCPYPCKRALGFSSTYRFYIDWAVATDLKHSGRSLVMSS